GKEKGGRAIVWGDIALIDGNINAQGKDIAKTGGFVETSGHDLSIGNDVIIDAKEWLLDPDNVSIENPSAERNDSNEDLEYTGTGENINNPKRNNQSKKTLTSSILESILKKGSFVNITATDNIYVNSSINIGDSGHLILSGGGRNRGGVEINEDITSTGGNLTISSKGWVNIHKNITLSTGFLNITSNDSVAFEKAGKDKARNAADAQIVAQGIINLTGENKTFRLNNVSLNGVGQGLSITSNVGNQTHKFDGEINITGNVTINQTAPATTAYWNFSYDSYWNVSTLNVQKNSSFTFIKRTESNRFGPTTQLRSSGGVFFNGTNGNMVLNVGTNSRVLFNLKPNENTNNSKPLPLQFNANITAIGGGSVSFDIHANHSGRGAELKMNTINISDGTSLTLQSHVRKDSAFKISKDLTINATGSNFTLEQSPDSFTDKYPGRAISSTKNITISGGNVSLGGQNSSSDIKGNITIKSSTNVTLKAHNSPRDFASRTLTLGNLNVEGNLTLTGSVADIKGNLSILNDATFKGETSENLNITGNFTNNGTADINIKQGVVNIQGNITNKGGLNITTNAQNNQKTIINGNITNEGGDLNIKDSNNNAEIQIGGNISQKKGNLTISSDKINITKKITIKAGVDEGGSDSSPASNANLTIKTKTLELTGDLNISGFNKAEITAKNGNDLTIGKASDGNANAKKVTFDKVKDSKISANGHNVTLNSKVETSNSDSSADDSNDNNTGLTISAKDVTVNNDVTSHKTINISATTGNVTTKESTTINAATGSVEVTAKTGDISGTISGNTVNVTATDSLTTQASSSITSSNGQTTLTAKNGSIAGSIDAANVTLNTTGTLTTVAGSNIKATSGTLAINAKDAKLDGTASGDRTVVNATNASGSGSVTAATSSNVNITGDLSTINGLNIISKNGKNTVVLKGAEIDVKYIQPGVASANEVIEAKRALEKVKDLSDEERETLAKLGVSAVRFVEPNNTITVNTQNEFTTRPSSQVTISEDKACFSSGNGAAVCTNVTDDRQ
ncbi:adhesin, partial [Haemophilus influenzae]